CARVKRCRRGDRGGRAVPRPAPPPRASACGSTGSTPRSFPTTRERLAAAIVALVAEGGRGSYSRARLAARAALPLHLLRREPAARARGRAGGRPWGGAVLPDRSRHDGRAPRHRLAAGGRVPGAPGDGAVVPRVRSHGAPAALRARARRRAR